MSRKDTDDFRKQQSSLRLRIANMVRRVSVAVATGGAWAIQGYEYEDPDTGLTVVEGVDDDPAEVFNGIGIYAKPAADDNAEGILLHIGGEAEHPVITAIRNEDARKRYVAEFSDLAAGEIAIFNSAGDARAIIKANGEIELTPATGEKVIVKRKGGTAAPVALLSDVQDVRDDLDGHEHMYSPGAGSPTPTSGGPSVTSPTGTDAFDSE